MASSVHPQRSITRVQQIKILYLGANPYDTPRLKLEEETQKIQKRIREARYRDALVFQLQLAVQPEDLLLALQDHEPQVVHFSGHGIDGAILLQDDRSRASTVGSDAMVSLLSEFKEHVRLVVLNACNSRAQAEALVEHIDCAVGMDQAISDEAATKFAAVFYRNIGFGLSVHKAFVLALNALDIEGIGEHARPRLFARRGADPKKLILIAPEPWRSWRWLALLPLVLGVMLLSGGVEALRGPLLRQDGTAPAPSAPPPSSPPLEPFLASAAGIVVAAPPGAEAPARALCEDVRSIDPGQVTPCAVRVRQEGDAGAIEDEARRATASLLVVVSAEGAASISPLLAPSMAELLEGMPPVDVARGDGRKSTAHALHALARIAASRDAQLSADACPPLDRGAPDRLSLLVALFVPSCFPDTVDPMLLLSGCDRAESSSDWTCALASLLYVERLPTAADSDQRLANLRDRAPEPFRRVARVKLALDDCERRRFESSTAALLHLEPTGDACARMTLVEVAACLSAAGPQAGMRDDEAAKIRELEDLPVLQQQQCFQRHRALVLGQRARWRGRAGRWKAAAEDYRDAYFLSHDPGYALDQAESLLHQQRAAEADDLLVAIQRVQLTRSTDVFRGAVLRWIAAREMGSPAATQEADVLLDLYDGVALGDRAIPDEDADLRALACPLPAARCVYDVLAGPKSRASATRLGQTLASRR